MRYAIIKPDGSHEVVESEKRLNYKEIQKLVAAPGEEGPLYQAIGGPSLSILINENGKYLPLETNVPVTRYARANRLIWPHDDIRGDCVIMGEPDDEGYEKDMDDAVLNDILSYND
jgi:hypothetical protein